MSVLVFPLEEATRGCLSLRSRDGILDLIFVHFTFYPFDSPIFLRLLVLFSLVCWDWWAHWNAYGQHVNSFQLMSCIMSVSVIPWRSKSTINLKKYVDCKKINIFVQTKLTQNKTSRLCQFRMRLISLILIHTYST
jgi:hypothetical protein